MAAAVISWSVKVVAALLFLEGKSGSFSCCFLVGKGGSCPVISGR